MTKITKVHARQVFDSRGNPTVEAEIQLENNKNEEARSIISGTIIKIKNKAKELESSAIESSPEQITELTSKMKFAQEKYASALSKHESIKTETIKRQERIKNIDSEIQNWKNLRFNSEKMSKELDGRLDKIRVDLENITKLPETMAIKNIEIIKFPSFGKNPEAAILEIVHALGFTI